MSYDWDAASAALISQLILDDIEEINGRRKGKGRDDVGPSDEEIAFRIQEESFRAMLMDVRLAQSIDQALMTDADVLAAEQAAHDDREYAQALAEGRPLPEQSEHQRSLEGNRPSSPPTPDDDDDTSVVRVATSSNTTRMECVICGDGVHLHTSYSAPCRHRYCLDCLRDLIRACVNDESLYPPRCCNQPFIHSTIFPLLDKTLHQQFEASARELGTLAVHRLYCTTATCSTFLGSTEEFGGEDVPCTRCLSVTCSACKQPSHPGALCPEDQETLAVRAFAAEQHWQTCPGCQSVIELHHGCYHMTCRCRTQFCYVCAERWKHCTCPQWDEERLVAVAERQVANEMPRAPAAQPEQAQAQIHAYRAAVQRRVVHLRNYHDCDEHRWRRRGGGAQCEECNHYLPEFILVCRNCHLEACVRCSRNRL